MNTQFAYCIYPDTEYITPKDSFDFSYLPTKNTLIKL